MKVPVKLITTLEEALDIVATTILSTARIATDFSVSPREQETYIAIYETIVRDCISKQSDTFKAELLEHYKLYNIEIIDLMYNDVESIIPSDFDFLSDLEREKADILCRILMVDIGKSMGKAFNVPTVFTEDYIDNYFKERNEMIKEYNNHADNCNRLFK